ncbi:MAG: hypothetical protein NW214_01050 [Pseudanabaenaceae cyanobacterium bins.39]|nr:hypothetical protein [Pseudanabaenaceae cyanobacterium bins.39]
MKFLLNSKLNTISTAAIATTAAGLTAISAPVSANAATFTFNNIVPDNVGETIGDVIAPYLSMDVTASGSGTLFKFNLGNTAALGTAPYNFSNAFIRQVFIDGSPSLLGIPTLNQANVGTVNFVSALTGTFSQGNKIGFTYDYYFNRSNGSANGFAIQKNESLGVLFANANYNNVISAINSGALRVGYHVQGFGESDSYVNGIPTPPRPVPVPGFLLGLVAAGGFGASRVIKTKKQATV